MNPGWNSIFLFFGKSPQLLLPPSHADAMRLADAAKEGLSDCSRTITSEYLLFVSLCGCYRALNGTEMLQFPNLIGGCNDSDVGILEELKLYVDNDTNCTLNQVKDDTDGKYTDLSNIANPCHPPLLVEQAWVKVYSFI